MNNPIYTAKNYSLLIKHGERGKDKKLGRDKFFDKKFKN